MSAITPLLLPSKCLFAPSAMPVFGYRHSASLCTLDRYLSQTYDRSLDLRNKETIPKRLLEVMII
ncbi:predicted protein [Plenodomus lingam JN3]|uniref:Predicted protein n=1 Tax=Leptosphaeria maculans (strain JN3 / isolate v23.1.3 / race Av1-4-5-6-7-8) TaxID=985895 RepID=E5ACP3_LEPMJ|nr:predicted protein [Plenodomus lingam JN3]CBY02245.1 predicted protein [Plenodomus lingam JN3]